ncbi:MAG: phytanoyl-CoA dioxygenase family protein [Flavobacteriales bacterium]|nr:phytanoyl-CoA dioxygenase family protein [Flavobacteriales bacterium]
MIDFSNKIGIFKDAELQETFHREGYVVVPFISETQIHELLALYSSLYPNGVEGFFTTTFANDVHHREKVNQSIREICSKQIEDLFEHYKILFSSYIVKAPGPKSELIMHQDMTLVDEKKFSGINIWCPLVDLTSENGAIEVLPQSHRFFETYRGSSLPDIYDNVVDEIKPLMKSCQLKAGEAIIFDQSIIHYSPPNLSREERPVINTFVAHRDAKIKICYWDKDNYGNQVEIFEQEDNFLEQFENFGHNIFNQPNIGKSLGLFPYDFPKLTAEMLNKKTNVLKETANKKKSWFQRIFSNKAS